MSDTADTRLDRREVVKQLLENRDGLLVVSGLGSPTYDVAACGDHPKNFYLWGAMGSAVSIGLGLARAQPETPVAVITGDGEMLMGLGALATASVQSPPNLTVIVLDNGHYGETGMQLSHTGGGLRLHKVAGAMGFESSSLVSTMQEVADLSARLHKPEGLGFACVEISSNPVERCLPSRDGIRNKLRFREALGLPVSV